MAAHEYVGKSQTSRTEETSTESEDSGWETESSTDCSAQPFKMMNPEELAEEVEVLSETVDLPAQPGLLLIQ